MDEQEVRGKDLHCLKCLQRFTEALRPVVKRCRHLACQSCSKLPSYCELCGDLQEYSPVAGALQLSERVLEISKLFTLLDTAQSEVQRAGLVKALRDLLPEVEDKVKFEKVPCAAGAACRNRTYCSFSHDPVVEMPPPIVLSSHPYDIDSSLRSAGTQEPTYLTADSSIVSLEHMILEVDHCDRCKEVRRTTLVPFCVNCGYIKQTDILQGKSLQDPLSRG